MRLRGILFDLDGTLFAREAAFWSWVSDEAAARELDWASIAELDARGRGPKVHLLEHLALALSWPERSLEARLQRARRGMLRYAQPDERLSQLLARLGRSFRLGLVTNGASESQRGKLRAMQIEHYFEPVIVSAEVGHRKPEFAIFRLATRAWQIPPAEVLFVGDDPLADIGGARGAGMLPLQVLREPIEPIELEGLGLLPNAHEPSDGTVSIPSLWHLERWLSEHVDGVAAP
jgi:putative hydrolase of the HAD superfamily